MKPLLLHPIQRGKFVLNRPLKPTSPEVAKASDSEGPEKVKGPSSNPGAEGSEKAKGSSSNPEKASSSNPGVGCGKFQTVIFEKVV